MRSSATPKDNPMNSNPIRAEAVERAARAIFAAAQAEAKRVDPNAPLPSFDEDDEDSRQFCRDMARAALEAGSGDGGRVREALLEARVFVARGPVEIYDIDARIVRSSKSALAKIDTALSRSDRMGG
jgi:hypothetical protein